MLDHGAWHVGVNFGLGGSGGARPLYMYPRLVLFIANTGVKKQRACLFVVFSFAAVRLAYSLFASRLS